jgi:hypothetical protein
VHTPLVFTEQATKIHLAKETTGLACFMWSRTSSLQQGIEQSVTIAHENARDSDCKARYLLIKALESLDGY